MEIGKPKRIHEIELDPAEAPAPVNPSKIPAPERKKAPARTPKREKEKVPS